MLVSVGVNKVIRKTGRPFCLIAGTMCMGIATLMLVLAFWAFPAALTRHWSGYMISVASLAFVMGPATSYALGPWSDQAGVASALLGFIQMDGGAGSSLLVLTLPLSPKPALSLVLLAGAVLAFISWRTSQRVLAKIHPL